MFRLFRLKEGPDQESFQARTLLCTDGARRQETDHQASHSARFRQPVVQSIAGVAWCPVVARIVSGQGRNPKAEQVRGHERTSLFSQTKSPFFLPQMRGRGRFVRVSDLGADDDARLSTKSDLG